MREGQDVNKLKANITGFKQTYKKDIFLFGSCPLSFLKLSPTSFCFFSDLECKFNTVDSVMKLGIAK